MSTARFLGFRALVLSGVGLLPLLPTACEGRSSLDADELFPPPFDGGLLVDSGAGLGSGSGGVPGSGGFLTTGGEPGSGGKGGSFPGGTVGAGGSSETGGAVGSGGVLGAGGIPGSGGTVSTGGTVNAGGTVGNGGTVNAGGVIGNGGAVNAGGAVGSGGAVNAGGTVGNGGAMNAGGTVGNGGAVNAGGTVGSGGALGAGGFVPTCSSITCPTGCCDASGACVSGRLDDACGTTAHACADCTSTGQHCAAAGFCYSGAHCGPDDCGGCCMPNGACRPGTTARACGVYGGLCDACGTGETCQSGACAAPGQTCPDPYGGCAPGSVTTPPQTSTACTAANLSALQRACKGRTSSPSCTTAATALARSNPECFTCVSQFFGATGVAKCLAPFLTTACNEALTCATDCLDGTCGGCSSADQSTCQRTVFASGGACTPYVAGGLCADAAFGGDAAFCDFDTISDIGLFLQGVGAYYCSK